MKGLNQNRFYAELPPICVYSLGDPETALDWIMKILTLDPLNELAKENFRVYEIQIMKNNGEIDSEESDAKEITDFDKHENNTIIYTDDKGEIVYENKEIYRKDNSNDKKEINENGHTDAKEITKDEINENNANITTDEKGEIVDEHKEVYKTCNSDDESEISDNGQTKIVNRANDSESDFIKKYADMKNGTDICTTDESTKSSSSNKFANVDISTKSDSNATNDSEKEKSRELLEEVIDLRKDIIAYEALCRGEYDVAPEISARLTCRYLNDKPFLKLAPIKAEQRYINPDVFLFYDVISDEEIEHVQEQAKPKIKRAMVGLVENNSSAAVVDYRISQNSWLGDDKSAVVARLTQRVGDFTGLNMDYAEYLQVANYGVGGHYEPHVNYFGKDASAVKGDERIATTMFYMSDVTQGGATVFPKLGLSVFPVKGSAIFWMNLLPSGEGNLNTRHAACPVLEGYKWVANKWIPILGQEFIKPCNLEYQRTDVIQQQPAPVLTTEYQKRKTTLNIDN